ncbi:MAG: hypothetical protein HJJLKODD_00361 [Phycisphaerae bacterium]|nr:hypothetical protein [Phycisphaerae bacterium]
MMMQGGISRWLLWGALLLSTGCTTENNLFRRNSEPPAKQVVETSTTQSSTPTSPGDEAAVQTGQDGRVAEEYQNYINSLQEQHATNNDSASNGTPDSASQTPVTTAPADDHKEGQMHYADSELSTNRAVILSDDEVIGQKQPGLDAPQAPPVIEAVTIKPVTANNTSATDQQVMVVNAPVEMAVEATGNTIDREIQQLQEYLRSHPQDVRKHMQLKYLYLAKQDVDRALALPEGLEQEQAQMAQRTVRAILAGEKAMEQPAQLEIETNRNVEEFSAAIRRRAELDIPRVALCSSIQSYGQYTEIPPGYFVQGRRNRAYLYCEVDYFASEKTTTGQHRVNIAHRLALLRSSDGQTVWTDTQPLTVEDISNNQRRDFFFNRLLQLPPGLPAGEYTLKVTVEDLIKQQLCETTYKIMVQSATLTP